ncbi:hypothetical protein [Dactylosporangium matsuzakiense]|nr:hypothetical protein [Dactylosporangium matsuzakiense]UWZ48897.1 hypothetical protein Dmats_22360 [Dactylosporangium matsuzakiense]
MTMVELAVGWLASHLFDRGRAQEAEPAIEEQLRGLAGLVQARLEDDPALQSLQREAESSPTPTVSTRRRVVQALEDAVWTDPHFGEALAAVVDRLRPVMPAAQR